jgi:peptidoglycan hydrolase CwlO-like protein
VPDELGDTRRRLDVVEQRLDAVESRINSEAGLRAMMDLDQATLTARFDAQDHLLRALAVTQSEHGTQLRKLATEQTRLAEEQSRLAGDQSRMADEQARTTSTIARVEAGVRTIVELLERDG